MSLDCSESYKKYFNKKNKILYFLILFCIQICSFILTVLMYDIGNDFSRSYYPDVVNFWLKNKVYNAEGFVYLSYFHVIMVWMVFFPLEIALFIHIIITDLMLLYVVNNVKDHQKQWFLWFAPFILIFSITFNTDIWCFFSLFYYQRHRNKWYSPLVLLLAFFKITTMIAFFFLLLINFYYERKKKVSSFGFSPKLIPMFIFVFIFIGSLSIPTINLFLDRILWRSKDLKNETSIFIFIQITHFSWYCFVISEFMKYNKYSFKKRKWFYRIIAIIITLDMMIIVVYSFFSWYNEVLLKIINL